MTKDPIRWIAHFDLDSFFVSVELLRNPELRGKPVIVGGSSDRGVVSACSYEARKYGIHSAMPIKQALRLCPTLINLPGTRAEYSRYSRWVTNIMAAQAPIFEKASIDEFYLDLTGMDTYFSVFEWTCALRARIMEETGLPISFGLAPNKMLAKMATNQAKPNGFRWVQYGEEQAFLDPQPINAIPGVGEETHKKLLGLGIATIQDLRLMKREMVQRFLGNNGVDLWEKAHGIHRRTVDTYHEAKSISTEQTFETNTTDVDWLLKRLLQMAEIVGYELRQDNKMTGCVTVKIRYPDFETTSKQSSIPYTFYDDEIIEVSKQLFHKLYRPGMPVRLLGIRLSELTDEAKQTNLFSDTKKKDELYKAIDQVKGRFGKNFIGKARGQEG
jgi:DNA polymerase-4